MNSPTHNSFAEPHRAASAQWLRSTVGNKPGHDTGYGMGDTALLIQPAPGRQVF